MRNRNYEGALPQFPSISYDFVKKYANPPNVKKTPLKYQGKT
jgi:hypothetical protein